MADSSGLFQHGGERARVTVRGRDPPARRELTEHFLTTFSTADDDRSFTDTATIRYDAANVKLRGDLNRVGQLYKSITIRLESGGVLILAQYRRENDSADLIEGHFRHVDRL
jgi:hypothetical protein